MLFAVMLQGGHPAVKDELRAELAPELALVPDAPAPVPPLLRDRLEGGADLGLVILQGYISIHLEMS